MPNVIICPFCHQEKGHSLECVDLREEWREECRQNALESVLEDEERDALLVQMARVIIGMSYHLAGSGGDRAGEMTKAELGLRVAVDTISDELDQSEDEAAPLHRVAQLEAYIAEFVEAQRHYDEHVTETRDVAWALRQKRVEIAIRQLQDCIKRD